MSSLSRNHFEFILSSVASLYGTTDITKCLSSDDGRSIEYTNCSWQIIDELAYAKRQDSDPFVRFFLNSVKSFHNRHKCSTRTLVCFSAILWRHVDSYLAQDQSISRTLLVQLMPDVLEEIIEQYVTKNNKLVHSLNRSLNVSQNLDFYRNLVNGLCRNKKPYCDLVMKCILKYETHSKDESVPFSADSFLLCVSSRQKSTSKLFENTTSEDFGYHVESGICISLDSVSTHLKSSFNNCLLVDSNLTHDHIHLGFNHKLEFESFSANITPQESYESIWLKMVKESITANEINVIFVGPSRKVNKDLRQFCDLNSVVIVPVSMEPFKVLKKLFNKRNKCPLVYMEDLKPEQHVLALKLKLTDTPTLAKLYLVVQDPTVMVISVLIESRLSSVAEMYKETLVHILKRVENVFNQKQYVNGSGKLEYYLYEKLSSLNQPEFNQNDESDNEDEFYKSMIKTIYSMSFRDLNLLIKPQLNADSDLTFYDDLYSKLEAWQSAVSLISHFIMSEYALQF